MPADPASEATAAVARALVGGQIDAVERVRGFGRNSGVWRVRSDDRSYALKQYPQPDGTRDRASIEFGALRFLAGHAIEAVPRALAVDPIQGYALLEWIDGEPVAAPSEADIRSAADFLGAVHALRNTSDAAMQPQAAEACLSGAEIVEQIERRLARLVEVQPVEPTLGKFLEETVRPLLIEITAWARTGYDAANLSFVEPSDASRQTLCPSDFGFHNAMRRSSGELVFIDFDYFGWDDPVKLIADILLHPGMLIREPLKRQFATSAIGIYRTDETFPVRLPLLYPLFAVRWCMILLNEFLPERWVNRVKAGEQADWASAKQRQLDRAREWMHSLAANFQRFPYGE